VNDAPQAADAAAAPAANLELSSPPGRARGYWSLIWRRFKRDRIAVASGVFLILLVLLVFAAYPLLVRALGHGPDDIFPGGAELSGEPVGPWTWVPDTTVSGTATENKTLFLLGGDGSLGRDEFLRLLRGGQSSLEVGIGSALLALLIGVPLGALAGYLGGWVDAVVSRLTEFFMGFPILIFLIALGWTIRDRILDVTFGGLVERGVLGLVVLIGIFSWFYPARIVRAQVLALRDEPFVEAARSTGAGTWRIIRSHFLPHLVGVIAVYGSLIVATNIVLESAISFLNIGIPLPGASWGNMLSTNWGHFFLLERPGSTIGIVTSFWTTFWPAAAILVTVLALTLFAEGVREAFEPGSRAA
jgi:peptide/nickel transport system permease protein